VRVTFCLKSKFQPLEGSITSHCSGKERAVDLFCFAWLYKITLASVNKKSSKVHLQSLASHVVSKRGSFLHVQSVALSE